MTKYIRLTIFSLLTVFAITAKPHAEMNNAVVGFGIATGVSVVGLVASGIALGVLSNVHYCPNGLELDSEYKPYSCYNSNTHHYSTCWRTEYFCRNPETKVVIIDPAPTRYGSGREDAK